ncbi:hypothetical protein GGF31_008694 [Allomyces arbusculus]|nr:hypothetical protein GGF31_008694 [Allomyces arbusculus]
MDDLNEDADEAAAAVDVANLAAAAASPGGPTTTGMDHRDATIATNAATATGMARPIATTVTATGMAHHKHPSEALMDEDQPPTAEVLFGVVDQETRQYFKSIEGRIDMNEWESEEDLQIFLSNVYEEVQDKELVLATDAETSVVLEKLLRISSDVHLRIFMDKMSGNFVHLFKHFCASHVCQTLLVLAADVLEREARGTSPDNAPDDLPTMTELVTTMCEQLRTFLAVLSRDRHSTFVIRVLLSVLSGTPLTTAAVRSKKSKAWNQRHNATEVVPAVNSKPRTVPAALAPVRTAVLDELTTALAPHARTFAFDPVVNPVLQLLLGAVADKDALVKTLLMQDSANASEEQQDEYVNNLMETPVGSRLFEKVLAICSATAFHQIYTRHFRGKLATQCRHPAANFVVQALIANVKSESQMELLLDELAPAFDQLLFRGRPLIIVQFLELAHKYKNYRTVLKPLYAAIGIKRPRDLLPTLLYLNRNYPGYDDADAPATAADGATGDESVPNAAPVKRQRQRHRGGPRHDDAADARAVTVSPAGNQIITTILRMPAAHNKELVDSFLAREMTWYHPYMVDPVVSFTLQAFLTAPTVNVPPKRKLLFSLLNHTSDMDLATLAADKFGSHIVDALWAMADLDAKDRIAADLLAHEKKVTGSRHGTFVWRNCGLEQYKKKRDEWMQRQQGIDKKKALFQDLLDDETTEALATLGMAPPTKANDDDEVDEELEDVLVSKKKKRVPLAHVEDEIDQVFKSKSTKGLTHDEQVEYVHEETVKVVQDKNMAEVLDAIKATKKRKKSKKAAAEKEADSDEDESSAKRRKKKRAKRQFAS